MLKIGKLCLGCKTEDTSCDLEIWVHVDMQLLDLLKLPNLLSWLGL